MENRDIVSININEFKALSVNNEKLECLINIIEEKATLLYDNKSLYIEGGDIMRAVKILFPCTYKRILNAKQNEKESKEKEK